MSVDLLPGEVVLHEERGAAPSFLPISGILTLAGLALLSKLSIVGVVFAMLCFYLAYRNYLRFQGKTATGPLRATVTNRRVIAFRQGGQDEIQLTKVETVTTDQKGVLLRGSGGTQFRVDAESPDKVRSAVQRALADHIK